MQATPEIEKILEALQTEPLAGAFSSAMHRLQLHVGEALEQEGGLPTAFALCSLAVVTAVYDGQDEEQLITLLRAAWQSGVAAAEAAVARGKTEQQH